MRKHIVIAIAVAVLAVVAIVLLLGPAVTTKPGSEPVADNTAGPAEAGALETGGALDPNKGFERMPARDMPHTIKEYPPAGPETNNPPPSQK